MTNRKKEEPGDVLFRIKRGLCGYVSYLAACDVREAFSEYVLYEPILRIMKARGFKVNCEVPCPGVKQPKRGDKRKLDFYATGHSREMAIEVKWVTQSGLSIDRDLEKLRGVLATKQDAYPLLCVFGRKSFIEEIDLSDYGFVEKGHPVYADLKRTRYGCRIFQLKTDTAKEKGSR
jgi:hypothetical protein